MKKLIILLTIISTTILISCDRTENNYYLDCALSEVTVPQPEKDSLNNYITQNMIAAEYDERGFYYILEAAGEDLHPDRCYSLSVDYKTYNFNGVYIDNGTGVSLRMHRLINGFQYGCNKIGVNGKIKIFLPPSLAYGATGSSPAVGANEYLIFEITLNALTFNNLNN